MVKAILTLYCMHQKLLKHICGNYFHYCTTSLLQVKLQKTQTQLWKIHKHSCTTFQSLLCAQTQCPL